MRLIDELMQLLAKHKTELHYMSLTLRKDRTYAIEIETQTTDSPDIDTMPITA